MVADKPWYSCRHVSSLKSVRRSSLMGKNIPEDSKGVGVQRFAPQSRRLRSVVNMQTASQRRQSYETQVLQAATTYHWPNNDSWTFQRWVRNGQGASILDILSQTRLTMREWLTSKNKGWLAGKSLDAMHVSLRNPHTRTKRKHWRIMTILADKSIPFQSTWLSFIPLGLIWTGFRTPSQASRR